MTMQSVSKSPIGLDGVPAAETALSHVDGQKGELIIAGERVADLATNIGEDAVFLAEGKQIKHHAEDQTRPSAPAENAQ